MTSVRKENHTQRSSLLKSSYGRSNATENSPSVLLKIWKAVCALFRPSIPHKEIVQANIEQDLRDIIYSNVDQFDHKVETFNSRYKKKNIKLSKSKNTLGNRSSYRFIVTDTSNGYSNILHNVVKYN